MIVDFHSHFLPAEITKHSHFYRGLWSDIEAYLAKMDEAGIDLAVITYPTTDSVGEGKLTETELARVFNNAISEIVKIYPKRFIGTAVVPVEDSQEMVRELKCAHELGLKGVSLASSYNGVYLDDEQFFPLYEEAQKNNLPIFVHATINQPIGTERVKDPLLTPVIEYVFDITMCISKLMMSGVFNKFPNLKFVFAHFGGVMPFILRRFDTTYTMLRGINFVKDLGKSPSEYFKNIYVDTSGTSSVSNLLCALEMVDSTHILFGSDYPANRDVVSAIKMIKSANIAEQEKNNILGQNFKTLFVDN